MTTKQMYGVKNGGNGGQRLVDRQHSVTHGMVGNEEKVEKQGERMARW